MRRLGSFLLAGVLLAGCSAAGSPAPTSTASATPASSVVQSPIPMASAIATPTPSASATGSVANEPIWVRVANQSTFVHAVMNAVVAGPDRYVAVGCVTEALDYLTEDDCTGASWVSTDGRSWRRSDIASSRFSSLDGVISTPLGYVAWGGQPADTIAIWRSSDGLTWQRATTSMGGRVGDVVWWDGRLIAYRFDLKPDDPSAASIITSTDGVTWTVVTTPGGCTSLPEGRFSELFAIDGRLVAPGWTRSAADDLWHGNIAASPDGRCWSLSSPTGGTIAAIAAFGSGFVAVGSEDSQARAEGDPPPPMAAWASTDGLAFTRVRLAPSAPRGGLGQLVSSGGRLTALGEALTGDWGYEPTIWTSTDGRAWTEAVSVPDATTDGLDIWDCTGGPCDLYRTKVSGLAARPGSLVAVGRTRLPQAGYRAVVWIADAVTATPPVRLPVGTEAVTVTSDLRVRSQPRVADDSIKYEPLLAKGTLLHVVAGPVYGSGFWWYRVEPYVSQDGAMVRLKLSSGATDGWVAAAARDGAPWIGVYQDVDCGPNPCPSA